MGFGSAALRTGISLAALLLTGFAPHAEPASTQRYVHGVITSVDPVRMTIATQTNAVSGKIDPLRTKVTVHGKPGKVADLQVTAHAKGELCLDDVWLAVDAH